MTERPFAAGESHARRLDEQDVLAEFRDRFWVPTRPDGSDKLYFCGNSLGLQPKAAADDVLLELRRWREKAVEGHFDGDPGWISYQSALREPLAALVGAQPQEVVAMNSLTVNLHLMLVSFYRPGQQRYRIVMEKQAFPSDRYAVASQLRFHGFDPDDALVELEDEAGSARLSSETLASYLDRHGDRVALVLMPGVQYLSGQLQDMEAIARLAHEHGCKAGFDLAHAIGNVPLALHDWGADFAVWCSYKYLNGGPGAVAGCFVHERHGRNTDIARFNGWWGHEAHSRFQMGQNFVASAGADAWQLSNASILSLAPLKSALAIYREAGMERLRAKSIRLTDYLHTMVEETLGGQLAVLTPSDSACRGCQLSLQIRAGRAAGRMTFEALQENGVVCDWREPDVIRIAPVPLYNRFIEVWHFVKILNRILGN